MVNRFLMAASLGAAFILSTPVLAQDEPEPLRIYFQTGESAVSDEGVAVLDEAARLFRDGNPIVMIVAGGADTVGQADYNLSLSIQRAQSVADGLVQRGIPVGRLQVLGRGNSELPVETDEGIAEQDNRVVEISWR